jgi:hypothetical protein
MAKFLLLLSAAGVGLSGVAAQADYTQRCPYPYDVCGWTLSSGTYGGQLAHSYLTSLHHGLSFYSVKQRCDITR